MDTNNQEFQRAYTNLVRAFFEFMNVVNPGSAQQNSIGFIASQLNQLLNYIEGGNVRGVGTSGNGATVNVNIAPEPNTVDVTGGSNSNDVISGGATNGGLNNGGVVNGGKNGYVAPEPLNNPVTTGATTTVYSPYPEFVKGQYKFKSSSLKTIEEGKPINEPGSDNVYKLTINEETGKGIVELMDISLSSNSGLLKIVANNPSMYLPMDLCDGAAAVSPTVNSISSATKLPIEKAPRGWVIPAGYKFTLNVG